MKEKKRGGKITWGGESDFVVVIIAFFSQWSFSVDHGDRDRVEYIFI